MYIARKLVEFHLPHLRCSSQSISDWSDDLLIHFMHFDATADVRQAA